MAGTVPLRLPRATVFTAVCTGVSSTGHVLASGHAVPPFGLAAGFVLLLSVSYGLCRSEQRLGALVATTLWGQVASHLLFAVTSSGGSASHTVEPGALAGTGTGPGMILAHVVAGTVCAWWLRRGERAVFVLADLARDLLHRLLYLFVGPVSVPHPRPGRNPGWASPLIRIRLLFLRHVRVLRGPPAASFV